MTPPVSPQHVICSVTTATVDLKTKGSDLYNHALTAAVQIQTATINTSTSIWELPG